MTPFTVDVFKYNVNPNLGLNCTYNSLSASKVSKDKDCVMFDLDSILFTTPHFSNKLQFEHFFYHRNRLHFLRYR